MRFEEQRKRVEETLNAKCSYLTNDDSGVIYLQAQVTINYRGHIMIFDGQIDSERVSQGNDQLYSFTLKRYDDFMVYSYYGEPKFSEEEMVAIYNSGLTVKKKLNSICKKLTDTLKETSLGVKELLEAK